MSPEPPAQPHTSSASEHPLQEMLRVALPTVAAMISYTLMTFVDKLLVSRIGPDPIYVGGQGNGGLASWIPISVAHGLLPIINTFVSQNMGAGKPERGPRYAWSGVWLGLLYWLVVLVPLGFTMPTIFNWLANTNGVDGAKGLDPRQALIAGEYAQILLLGACLTIAGRAFGQFFYGMHRARVVMAAGVIANVVNLALSYCFIFGKLGLPALGVKGSAYGTVIATGVEMLIPMAVFLSPAMNRALKTRASWKPSLKAMGDLLKLGWPGALMFGNEMICWGYFMVHLVSQFGKNHATAGWIAHQYMSLSFMPAVGMSVACTALVGKYMGMGRPDIAEKRAWLGVRITMAYMGLCGLCFILFRHQLIGFFIDHDTAPETAAELVRLGSGFLIACACFQLCDALAMTISGSLRGAGDTVVPGVLTVTASWLVIVGGGEFMVHAFPELRSLGPWIAAALYIFTLSALLTGRFLTGKWKKIRLVEGATPIAGH